MASKTGPEARPETVASRFVWAVGYFANEDYFVPTLHVEAMQHLSRGENLVLPNNNVANVRLKRHLKDEKKSAPGRGQRTRLQTHGNGMAFEF